MRRSTWFLLIVMLCCVGLLAAGASVTAHPAAPDSGAARTGSGTVVSSPLTPANVPLVRLPTGTNRGGTHPLPGKMTLVPINSRIYSYDMQAQSAAPSQAAAAAAFQPPAQPAGNAVGVSNAFMSVAPDVVRPSTTGAVATLASSFLPQEPVAFSLNSGAVTYFEADLNGTLAVNISTGTAVGYNYIHARGLTSGKIAGGVFLVSSTLPIVPGLAVSPHALTPGVQPFYLFGAGYPASTGVTIAADNNPVLTTTSTATGLFLLVSNVGVGPDSSFVFNSYVTAGTVGSMAGQSVEVRADAGPRVPTGDRNPARAFIDRPVVSNTVTTTLALTGEGFQPGETVNLTYLPGSGLGSTTADANGVVGFFLQAPPQSGVYDLRLNGQASGRIAYASALASGLAVNVPSIISAPANTNGSGTFLTLFDRFLPNQPGSIIVDSAPFGSTTTNADGYGAVSVPKPNNGRLVHSVAFQELPGVEAAVAPLMLSGTGVLSGTITDANTGLPIKGTLRIVGLTDGIVQSDPTVGGTYSLPLAPGSYNLTVTGSGCYVAQTITGVIVNLGATTVLNFALARSAPDAGGYGCYDNAGRGYVAAAQVVTTTFDNGLQNITFPFPMTYYGTTYITGTIDTNGFVTIGNQPTASVAVNTTIPAAALPNGVAYLNWDDLQNSIDANTGIYTDVIGTAPNRRFIVEWRAVRHAGDLTTTFPVVTNTMELQFDEQIVPLTNNDIWMVYPTWNTNGGDGLSSTRGLEDLTGTIAKQYQANTTTGALLAELNNYIWAGNSVRYYTAPAFTVTVTPTATGAATNTGTATVTSTAGTPTVTPTLPAGCSVVSNYTVATATAPIVPGVTDIGNHADDVVTNITLPFSYQLYDQTFTTANVSSNGNLQFVSNNTAFTNAALPSATLNFPLLPYWDDLRTDGSVGAGIFTSVSGSTPNSIFNIEWRSCVRVSAATCTAIDTNFEIRLYEGQNRFDFVYGNLAGSGTVTNGSSATVGAQRDTGSLYTQWSFNTINSVSPGRQLIFTQCQVLGTATLTPQPLLSGTSTPTVTQTSTATATPTVTQTSTATSSATPVPPTATATATACPLGQTYTVSNGSAAIVPGTTRIDGTGCDDCSSGITLPFPVTLYDQTFTTAQAGSNGYLSFGTTNDFFYTGCLPAPTFTYTILPFAVDQITGATGKGIYTLTTGSAPNRTFYVEWRACRYNTATSCLANSDNNYEVVFQEGQTSYSIRYGTFGAANATVGAIGVQKNGTTYNQTQCNAGPPAVSQQTYTLGCAVATVTSTATNVPNTATSTATATNVPNTATRTATATNVPNTATSTATSIIPTITLTILPQTATATQTALANTATATQTAVANTATTTQTATAVANTATTTQTATAVANTATATQTATAALPTVTLTVAVPTVTITATTAANTATATQTATTAANTATATATTVANTATATATATTVANTATSTATATACPGAIQTFSGAITAADPNHHSVVATAGDPSVCGTVSTYPGTFGAAPYNYDTYTVTNTSASPQCITVLINGSACGSSSDGVQVELYAGSFNPNNLAANYLGDSGGDAVTGARTVSVTVPGNTALVIVVDEYVSTHGCASYTLTVSGLPCVTGTATATSVPTTPTVTRTAVATATPCTIQFSDVQDPTAYYYQGVYYLACRGVISGYSDGTYKPFNNTTRAQMTKIVTLAFQIPLVTPPATGTFADVDSSSVFYQLIETAAARGIVSGYTCGGINPQTGTAEPCTAGNRPYFRPSNFVTRGQLAKIVVLGAGFALINPPTPTFTDVPRTDVFYQSIETAVCHGTITGYSDNTYRPNNYAFRGQIAKIVYLAVTNPRDTCPAATPLAR